MNSTEPCAYRVSVKGIAIDESGRFLLTKEDIGRWEMLGGGLEHDEDPIDSLKREIHEETGLVVTYISPTPKYFITCRKIGYGGRKYKGYVANIIYEIKLKDLNFVPSEECTELRFFNVDEARKVELFPNVEKFLDVFDPEFH
ncbi:NUDIX hydrolase [Candidatus Saccharibacteria bacterium]|nr:NUDIX hydrolase [Candidatus Saccharibacteria bacterium]